MPLCLPLSFLSSFLSPMLFPLLGMLAFFPLALFSFITDTPYTCAPLLCTYNTLSSTPLVLSLAFSTLLHTSLLYLLESPIYFGKLVSSFSLFPFCSIRLSIQILCTSNTIFLSFLLTLPLMKQEHTFL